MTTHLKVQRPGFHPRNACGDGGYLCSENIADVDCLRCAKKMGFTPKAKKGSDNPGGTCQVCFAVQRVMGGKTEALHGYNRPGNGYITGRCPGSQHLPFEKDCTLTKAHLARLETILVEKKAYLGELQAGKVMSVMVPVEMKDRTRKPFTINKGDERRYDVPGVRFNALPSFDEVLRREVAQVEGSIRYLELDIASLKKALAGWSVKELLP